MTRTKRFKIDIDMMVYTEMTSSELNDKIELSLRRGLIVGEHGDEIIQLKVTEE